MFVSRSEWGAPSQPAGNIVHPNNRSLFVVHHSTGDNLGHPDPAQWVKNIYNYHVYSNGWTDIGYNFLVDWDGNVYEGRGWERAGACQYGANSAGWCVCLLGNAAMPGNLTQAALAAIKALAEEADFRAGKQLERKGHREIPNNSTDCPTDPMVEWVHAGMPLAAVEQPNEKGRMILVLVDDGKVLGADADGTDNGTVVNQWALHARGSQVWGVEEVDGGVLLRNMAGDKVLSSDLVPGRRVILWERQPGNLAQVWKFEARTEAYVLVQVSSGLEVEIDGPAGAAAARLVEAGKGDLFVGVWLDG